MTTYKIVRFFHRHDKRTQIVQTGLTLQEAQDHCSDPETSSQTCTSAEGRERTRMHGAWFEGYQKEQ